MNTEHDSGNLSRHPLRFQGPLGALEKTTLGQSKLREGEKDLRELQGSHLVSKSELCVLQGAPP